MKLVNIDTLDEIELLDTFIWEDEFNWTPTASSHTYSLAGALIIETGVKLEGRPITISADNDMNWAPRSTIMALRAAAALTGAVFKLKLTYPTDSREFFVVFAPDNPIEAKPAKNIPQHADDDWFHLKMKLVEVAEPVTP